MNSVCIFCGSSAGGRPAYRDAAERMGVALAQRGLRLVYGGGHVGLMGVLADTVLAAGGQVVGVIPKALLARELGHTGLTELHVVDTMHERKALMADCADGFIALPGGFGTLDEFCEILTWAMLGMHQKPCGILDVAGFFAPLLAYYDRLVTEGFLAHSHRALVVDEDDPDRLLDAMEQYIPLAMPRWATPREV